MTNNQETALRSTISHAALSAGIAFSLTGIADTAAAQSAPAAPGPGGAGNVRLDPIDVEGAAADAEGSYTAQSASSPKQTAPLLDTPQTVTVIPRAVIQERGARNLTEVLRNTPGITFDAGENAFAASPNNFKLRGFDASGNIFIDGARDSGSYARDTFNIERVEVFKGPAADNGRGGAGGYVNMVTKSPLLENFIAGEVGFGFDEYDSKNRKRTTADINYMVTPTTAIRLNALWEDGGVAGREIAESNAWGIAPSIAFGLGTEKRAIFSYERLQRNDLPDFGVPGVTIPGTYRYGLLPSDDLRRRVRGAPRDAFYGLRSDFDDVTADSALARFEYDLTDRITLSNQTRWAQVDRTARFTLPNAPSGADPWPVTDMNFANLPTQTQFYDRVNTSLTNQTNLSAEFFTGAFKHNLALGVEFTREKSNANRQAAVSGGNTDFFDPDPDRQAAAAFNPTHRNAVKIDTVAAYLYDTIELSKHWQLTGGLRVEHYKVGIDSKTIAGAPAGSVDGYRDSATTVGGKLGIVYKPVENSSYYASFGLSHLPHGSLLSNPDISRAEDNAFPGLVAGAKPVRLHNYEVGAKWEFFDRRLQTGVALFRTEKHNAAIVGRDPDLGETADSLKGYGQQIVQGIEFSIAGELTERWKVFGGLLFLSSERKHSAYLDFVRREGASGRGDYGCPAAPAPCDIRTSGDELAEVPKFSGNLWTTYRFDNGWTLGGGVQYVGSTWVGRPDDATRIIKNDRYGKLPGYFLAHLMAAYEIRKDVSIVFNVDNVFDKTYATGLNWSTVKANLGAPRTYRVSTNFRF